MENEKGNKLLELAERLSPKKGTLIRELEDDTMKGLIMDTILPKIKPFIRPMLNKVAEMLGDDKYMAIIRKDKDGKPSVIIIENEYIESFNISDKAIKHAQSLEDFMDDILSMNMKDMFE